MSSALHAASAATHVSCVQPTAATRHCPEERSCSGAGGASWEASRWKVMGPSVKSHTVLSKSARQDPRGDTESARTMIGHLFIPPLV
jgi:hypothetical protein